MIQENEYFPQPEKQFQFSPVQASIWGGFILLGIVFKLQHWPGSFILLVSTGGMAGYNFIAFLLLRGKNILNDVLLSLGLLWLIYIIWGLVARGGHPYNEKGLLIHFATLVLTAAINGIAYRKYFSRSV